MTELPFAVAPILGLLKFTAAAGFALQNATPTIFTWTAPSDGAVHQVLLVAQMNVTSAETGGQVNLEFRDLEGNVQSREIFQPGQGTGFTQGFAPAAYLTQAGHSVSLVQTTALTAGAATLWAQLWGS